MMRYLGIFFTLIVATVLYVFPSQAHAFIPNINVRVVNGITGTPINGVWVKWTSPTVIWGDGYRDCSNPCFNNGTCPTISPRYERVSGTTGIAQFTEVWTVPDSVCNQSIDTNLDGSNDAVRLQCMNGTTSGNSSCLVRPEYSCGTYPNEFSVVQPSGDNGTYTVYKDLIISNHNADYNITLYYYPAGQPQEPEYAQCADGTTLLTHEQDLQRWDNVNQTITTPVGGTGKVKVYTGVGHAWDWGCNPGYGNDNNWWCDQLQDNEAVFVRFNGSTLGQTTDPGADYVLYYEYPITLLNGNNNFQLNPVAPNGNDMSLFTKSTICQDVRDRRATKKVVGNYIAPEIFDELTTLNQNSEYWLRLELAGHPTAAVKNGNYRVTEQINNAHFQFVSPTYNANPATSTFFVVARRPGDRFVEVTGEECPDANNDGRPDCISLSSGNRIDFEVNTIGDYHSEITLFFKVRATTQTGANSMVDVNTAASTFTHVQTGYTEQIDNYRVSIIGPVPNPTATPVPPTATPVPPTPTPVIGAATCDIYSYHEVVNGNDVQLMRINPSNGSGSQVGSVVVGKQIESVAIDPSNGVMYTMEQYASGNSVLHRVNASTGVLTRIGDIVGSDEISSLAFRPTDNTLWGWDHRDGLFEINKTTGAATLRFAYDSDTQGSGRIIEGMTWSTDGSKLWLTRGSIVGGASELWEYIIATNTIRMVYDNPFPGVAAGLDTMPDGTLLVGLEGSATGVRIIQYNPQTNTVVGDFFTDGALGDAEGVARSVSCPGLAVTPSSSISGRVFLDVNNNCTQESGEAATNEANVELNRLLPNSCPSYSQSRTPDASGNYSFNALNCFDASNNSTYRLSILPTNTNYTTTNCGGQFNINVNPGQNITRNFGLTIIRDPWFQGNGGGIHANGNVTSHIPNTATDRNLIRSTSSFAADVGSGETLATDNGNVSASNWAATNYTQSNYLEVSFDGLVSALTPYADRTNYNGAPPVAADAVSDGMAVYFAINNNVTLNGNWQDINFPVIVVVRGTNSTNGDVTIPNNIVNNRITLGPNGFLMIVAQRDIIVGNDIGETTNSSTTSNLEGIFIAGRNFNAGGTGDRTQDRRLNILGTVITGVNGSGSYVSQRTHEDNHLYPSDYFVFNPKLMIQAPKAISEPIYSWTEVR